MEILDDRRTPQAINALAKLVRQPLTDQAALDMAELERRLMDVENTANMAQIMPPLCEAALPGSLCQAFGLPRRDRLLKILAFLAPLTAPGTVESRVM